MKVQIQTDGACKNNPGPASIGIVLKTDDGILKFSRFIGEATNNIAEYQALIFGLEQAKRIKATSIELWIDSELVLKQLQGNYKVKDKKLIPLYQKAQDLLSAFPDYCLEKASRWENNLAHQLAQAALRKGLKS